MSVGIVCTPVVMALGRHRRIKKSTVIGYIVESAAFLSYMRACLKTKTR